VRSLALAGGAVTVASTGSYCVDAAASRPRDGFAVLASCARTADGDAHPLIDGLVIVQVGAPGSAIVAGGEEALADLLRGAEGAGLLGGAAQQVDAEPGTVYARLAEDAPGDGDQSARASERAGERTGERAGERTGAPLWRVFFDQGDRLVTATIRPFAGRPLGPREARQVLARTVSATRAASA